MDKETRNRIQRATQAARRLLEQECAAQLEGTFDILPDGTINPDPGAHLGDADRITRAKIVAAIEHRRAGGMPKAASVADFVREAAFTILNRFVALKMLEARGLILESVSRGEQSSGFSELGRLAPGLADLPDHGYRLYLECLFDELGREIGVLFDRRDPASLLWPRRQPFTDLLAILNDPDLAAVWQEDETIGWVYQYFNGEDERRQMRAESAAPRNSRELAVRNQFFTPRYVVQFLTDNTLGRIWYEMRHGRTRFADSLEYLVRRPNEVFLAEGEQPPVEDSPEDEEPRQEERLKKPHYVRFRPKNDPRDLRILDPACGSGHFLLYAFDLLLTIYEEARTDEASPGSELTGRTLREDYPDLDGLRRALPGLMLRHNLHGIEIDPRCAQIAALALWMRAQRAFNDFGIARTERPLIAKTNVVIAEPMPGEQDLLEEFLRELREDRLEGLIREALAMPPEKTVRATKAMADSLSDLVRAVWNGMELAGELGPLLKIELLLQAAIAAGREEWEGRLPLFRVYEYSLEGPKNEKLVRFVGPRDQDFWTKGEQLTLHALRTYAGKQNMNGRRTTRRLFADDAEHGFSFVNLCRQRFDVVLMNPPFGLASHSTKTLLQRTYPDDWTDLYSAFIARALEFLLPHGSLGVITPNLWLSIKRQESLRAIVSSIKSLRLVVDLGPAVLDDATVDTALSVIDNESAGPEHTVGFCRPPHESDPKRCLSHWAGSYVQLLAFRDIPTTPFCFDLGALRIALWSRRTKHFDPQLVLTFKGNTTFDNFRFVRSHWETDLNKLGDDWIRYDKGGTFQPYFNPSILVWRYTRQAMENRAFQISLYGTDAQVVQSIKHWKKAGLCYSRVCVAFSPRLLPADHVVNEKSIVLLPRQYRNTLGILSLAASSHIQDLLYAFGYHRSIEKGAVAKLPIDPEMLSGELEELGRTCVDSMWRLEATIETSPVFVRLAMEGERLAQRVIVI